MIYIDVDECEEAISGCHQGCNNTIGGYSCECDPGYELAEDEHMCDGG